MKVIFYFVAFALWSLGKREDVFNLSKTSFTWKMHYSHATNAQAWRQKKGGKDVEKRYQKTGMNLMRMQVVEKNFEERNVFMQPSGGECLSLWKGG